MPAEPDAERLEPDPVPERKVAVELTDTVFEPPAPDNRLVLSLVEVDPDKGKSKLDKAPNNPPAPDVEVELELDAPFPKFTTRLLSLNAEYEGTLLALMPVTRSNKLQFASVYEKPTHSDELTQAVSQPTAPIPA